MTDEEEIALVQRNGWTVRMMSGGAAYAALMGTEIHFRATDKPKAIQRGALRKFAEELLAEFGMLTTRVGVADEANQRFVKHMGFAETWTDGTYKFYLMTALPFERT